MKVWNETSNRYIAFIDIMGFKDYVYRNSHDIVKKRMYIFHDIIKDTEKRITKISIEVDNIDDPIKSVIFSDSIIIISKDSTNKSLDNILFTCQLLLAEGLKKGIPFKGAISYGKITANFEKSIFFGKPLIDAYSLQDQLYMYGIAIDHNVEKKLIKYSDLIEGYCCRGKTPTKNGRIMHYVINWMFWCNITHNAKIGKDITLDTEDIEKARSIIQSFYFDMSGYPRNYLDNTIEFLENVNK